MYLVFAIAAGTIGGVLSILDCLPRLLLAAHN